MWRGKGRKRETRQRAERERERERRVRKREKGEEKAEARKEEKRGCVKTEERKKEGRERERERGRGISVLTKVLLFPPPVTQQRGPRPPPSPSPPFCVFPSLAPSRRTAGAARRLLPHAEKDRGPRPFSSLPLEPSFRLFSLASRPPLFLSAHARARLRLCPSCAVAAAGDRTKEWEKGKLERGGGHRLPHWLTGLLRRSWAAKAYTDSAFLTACPFPAVLWAQQLYSAETKSARYFCPLLESGAFPLTPTRTPATELSAQTTTLACIKRANEPQTAFQQENRTHDN